MTDDELKALFQALQRENASMREENAVAHAETRRHFDVSTEAVRHEVRLVAEAVAQLEDELDRAVERLDQAIEHGFADTKARVERLEETTH